MLGTVCRVHCDFNMGRQIGSVYMVNRNGIKGLVIALSNSWGLLQIIIFMGCGIVTVPLSMLRKAYIAKEKM